MKLTFGFHLITTSPSFMSGEPANLLLTVTGEYTEGEEGTREEGFQVEPDYGPDFQIETVEDQFGTSYTKEDLSEDWRLIEDQGIEEANNLDA